MNVLQEIKSIKVKLSVSFKQYIYIYVYLNDNICGNRLSYGRNFFNGFIIVFFRKAHDHRTNTPHKNAFNNAGIQCSAVLNEATHIKSFEKHKQN